MPPEAKLRSKRPSRFLPLRGWILFFFIAGPTVSGLVSFLEILRDGTGGVDGLEGVVSVAISPDGNYVYATAQLEDTLAVFARDATNDTLTFTQVLRDETAGVFGLNGASSVAAAPEGEYVYATAFHDDAVGVFKRHPVLAGLVFTGVVKQNGVGGVFGLDGASASVVSPDGGHLLVTGKLDGALTVFARDASMDDLTLVDFEGMASGVDLAGASSLSFSPNGSSVYVSAENSDRLAVFRHDAAVDTPGALTFLAEYIEGVAGIDGLGNASSVTVSPDGLHVYVTGRFPGSLAVFDRDPGSGLLTQVQTLSVGTGFPSLAGASAVALPPNGVCVLVVSRETNSLTIFERDPVDGTLLLGSVLTDGVDGLDGLGGAIALDVSGDSQNVYVASTSDNALTSFLLFILMQDGFESGDLSRWSSSTSVR